MKQSPAGAPSLCSFIAQGWDDLIFADTLQKTGFTVVPHRTAPAAFSNRTSDTAPSSTVVGRCEQNPIPT